MSVPVICKNSKCASVGPLGAGWSSAAERGTEPEGPGKAFLSIPVRDRNRRCASEDPPGQVGVQLPREVRRQKALGRHFCPYLSMDGKMEDMKRRRATWPMAAQPKTNHKHCSSGRDFDEKRTFSASQAKITQVFCPRGVKVTTTTATAELAIGPQPKPERSGDYDQKGGVRGAAAMRLTPRSRQLSPEPQLPPAPAQRRDARRSTNRYGARKHWEGISVHTCPGTVRRKI